jgi:hypothetical protein
VVLLIMPPLYYYCVKTGWTFRALAGWLKRKFSRNAGAADRAPQEA